MRNVKVDKLGKLRCWHCGARAFGGVRTLPARVVRLRAFLTGRAARCFRCGQLNKIGRPEAYNGPTGREYKAEWAAELG